jgi:peptidoglycan hydrolase-like protein with peptidoglycan-binding domain
MKIKTIVVIVFASAVLLRADQMIESVQQALKDQGFYYGEVTGEKNADTIAAIRRFQIRNGLQVNGELNDETLRALGVGNSSQPIAKATPSATQDNSDLRSDSGENTERATRAPAPPYPMPPQAHQSDGLAPWRDRQVFPGNPATIPPEGGRLFAGTPYETAPPEVQRSVLVSAQSTLARRGLYRGPIDGVYGPNMQFSLRAYQSRVGLPTTGRLDLDTLAALELLPGANRPVYTPRRRIWGEPPVRGEWIRP